jgi:hypothetical protein
VDVPSFDVAGGEPSLREREEEELLVQALVEPFDLPGGGGRADTGVAMGDAVLPADAVEEDLDGVGTEPAGEDLSVVGQDLIGNPVAGKGLICDPGAVVR